MCADIDFNKKQDKSRRRIGFFTRIHSRKQLLPQGALRGEGIGTAKKDL